MKKLVLVFFFLVTGFVTRAQQPFFFKEAFATAVADTIFYPVHGSFKIDESSFGAYKNLQLWVYDARNKEVYYTVQSISTREEYADLVIQMIDKTYAQFMTNHGHILAGKCEETGLMEY